MHLQALRTKADAAAVAAEEAAELPPGLLRYSVTVAAGGGGRKGENYAQMCLAVRPADKHACATQANQLHWGTLFDQSPAIGMI